MLKIWGRLNSLNVQKVLLCCHELGLPFERVDAGMAFGVVQTAEYKAMNPNSVVPTIDDEGFILWESNVIVRYLCAKHSAGKLWPNDVQMRADIERWMDWQQTSFNGPLTQVFWGTVREPGAVPPSEIEKARARLDVTTAMLEARLDGRTWLSGADFGMADLVLASGIHRWINLPVDRPSRPRLEAYYRVLMQRPSAQAVLTLPLT
jgi:glutathione S-transferase